MDDNSDQYDDIGGYGQDDSAPVVAPPVDRPTSGIPQQPHPITPPAPPQPIDPMTAALLDPFTAGDNLNLQRLNAGLTQVRQDLGVGNIDANTAAEAERQIHEIRVPLLMRQRATQMAAQQQAQARIMHAAAQEQAVVQMNAAHDAQNFHARTSVMMDPVTGQTAHFFQKEPGKWEQVDFHNSPQANLPVPASQAGSSSDPFAGAVASSDPTAGVGSTESAEPPLADSPDSGEAPFGNGAFPGQVEGAAQGSGEGGPTILGPDGQPLTDQPRLRMVYDENGVAHHQRIPTLAERQAMDNAPTTQAQAQIASQIGHGTFQQPRPGPGGSLLVQQGPFTEAYENGRLVGTNRPQPQQAGGQAGEFTPEEIQHARNVAAAVTAGMPPGLHRDVQHGNAMRQTLLATAHQKEQDRRTAAATQQQQTKAAAAEKAKATAALEQERKESRTTAYKSVDEEYKSAIAAKAKDANATIPPQYATPEARLAEAQRIHRESWAATHPDSQEAKDIAAGKATGAATAPSDMDRIAALGKAAETHFNTPGQQGFLYNTGDANTAKALVDVLTPAFHENRPLTSAERQQYDTLQKTITDPQLKEHLDYNGKFAQGSKGIAATVQRGASGAPVYRDPKIAAQVNARLKEIGHGEQPKPVEEPRRVEDTNPWHNRR